MTGNKGCGDLELDSDEEWVVTCRSCGYRPFDDASCSAQQLLQWAGKRANRKRSTDSPVPSAARNPISVSDRSGKDPVVTAACPISDENAEVACILSNKYWVPASSDIVAPKVMN